MSRVPGTRFRATSSICARRVSSSPLWVPVGSYSVKVITGTSSMPRGLMTGWEAPRFCGNQSWFEYTWLYSRTRASWRAMPTSNCTVITAWPWRDTEYTCSTPLISLITCSAGVAMALSTSRVLAPGMATMMSAMVTSIWGSSSLGVTTTDRTPRIIARIASSGVRWLFWNTRAMAPDGPTGGRLSLTAVTPLWFRNLRSGSAVRYPPAPVDWPPPARLRTARPALPGDPPPGRQLGPGAGVVDPSDPSRIPPAARYAAPGRWREPRGHPGWPPAHQLSPACPGTDCHWVRSNAGVTGRYESRGWHRGRTSARRFPAPGRRPG